MKITSRNSIAAATAALLLASALSTSSHAATTTTPTTKPSIAGAAGQGGPADEGSRADVARHAAMAKYQACITATGVKMPDFGGFGGRGFNGGARPTGAPTARPTNAPAPGTVRPSMPALTAEQKAALAKCASLRPQFGRGFGRGGGPDDHNGSTTLQPGAGTIIKKSAAPMASKAATMGTPKTTAMGMGASYVACLNKAGINVRTAADVSKLDQGSPKVAAALKGCASKK